MVKLSELGTRPARVPARLAYRPARRSAGVGVAGSVAPAAWGNAPLAPTAGVVALQRSVVVTLAGEVVQHPGTAAHRRHDDVHGRLLGPVGGQCEAGRQEEWFEALLDAGPGGALDVAGVPAEGHGLCP